ncbi:hypothetical protein [Ohtaekwangia koreensis]|uniref:SpoIIAA-like n=1 Tax=Ohtaekwangia koreensis TaxID=688867 RepID=A0A1T5JUJ9_9BACT|nr:hypothetical protein [Ohtaekwangia koreensis]SKC54898.1 hypothetical protein SAMN05660236_1486 [Ohtaekwangia koreensis]
MEIYYDQDYVVVYYSAEANAVVMRWKAASTSEEYRAALNVLLAAIEHFKTGKVIADTTHLGTIHPDDQAWSVTEWTLKAISAGYSHLAIVLPTEVFTKMSVEETMGQVTEILRFSYFEGMDAAIVWIKQQ